MLFNRPAFLGQVQFGQAPDPCARYKSAMDQFAGQLAYYNQEANKALAQEDYKSFNQFTKSAMEALKDWEYWKSLYEACKRGENIEPTQGYRGDITRPFRVPPPPPPPPTPTVPAGGGGQGMVPTATPGTRAAFQPVSSQYLPLLQTTSASREDVRRVPLPPLPLTLTQPVGGGPSMVPTATPGTQAAFQPVQEAGGGPFETGMRPSVSTGQCPPDAQGRPQFFDGVQCRGSIDTSKAGIISEALTLGPSGGPISSPVSQYGGGGMMPAPVYAGGMSGRFRVMNLG